MEKLIHGKRQQHTCTCTMCITTWYPHLSLHLDGGESWQLLLLHFTDSIQLQSTTDCWRCKSSRVEYGFQVCLLYSKPHSIQWHKHEHSVISLLQTPLAPHEVSLIKEVSLFQRVLSMYMYMYMYIAGTTGSILIREMSLFRRTLTKRYHHIAILLAHFQLYTL